MADSADQPRGSPVGKLAAETAVAVTCGGVFGYALDKAKTNVPWVISEQMAMGRVLPHVSIYLTDWVGSALCTRSVVTLGVFWTFFGD
jgi:hypothetical protein